MLFADVAHFLGNPLWLIPDQVWGLVNETKYVTWCDSLYIRREVWH